MQDTNWKARYDRMKRHYNWTDAVVAAHVGQSAKAILSNVNRKNNPGDIRKFPSALRGMIVVFEIENGINQGATIHQ